MMTICSEGPYGISPCHSVVIGDKYALRARRINDFRLLDKHTSSKGVVHHGFDNVASQL